MTSKQIKKLDGIFGKLVRSRGRCEWCGGINYLQTAHIFSRRFQGTRWDQKNALSLCAGCHRKAHDRPTEFTEFVKDRLGELEYSRIQLQSYKIAKYINYEDILKQLETK